MILDFGDLLNALLYTVWPSIALVFVFASTVCTSGLHPWQGHGNRPIIATNEKVIHLDDIILRRSLIGMIGLVTGDLLVDAAEAAGAILGWSPERQQQEIERTVNILLRQHGVPADRLKLPNITATS